MVAEKEDLGSQDESHSVFAGELGGVRGGSASCIDVACVPT